MSEEFLDANGQPLKGLALVNAKRKAAKAAMESATAAPATEQPAPAPAAPAAEQPAPAPAAGASDRRAPPPAVAATAPVEPMLFDQLFGAAKVIDANFAPKHAKEDQEPFLSRLARCLAGASDEQWAGYTDAMRGWYNSAVDAMEASPPQPLPAPAGLTAAPKPQTTGAEAAAKLAESRAAKKAEKEAAKEAAKAERAAKKVKPPKAEGTVQKLRKLVLANFNVETAELLKLAEQAGIVGFSPSTLNVVRYDVHAVVKAIREIGFVIPPAA
jgi:2-oxoglutarate dehydrogenase E2 component (dihydrolipoamide succinyltransferase)